MDIISFMMGFLKGKASTPTQEKAVDITENGTTEVMPDDGYALSKVTVNTNVESSGGEMKKISKYVNITYAWKMRVSVEFGFKPKFLLIFPGSVSNVVNTTGSVVFFGWSSEFGKIQYYVRPDMDGKMIASTRGSAIDGNDENAPIYAVDETGFNMGNPFKNGGYYVVAFG